MEHILIVEDEVVIRSALRKLLERNGYKVSEAGAVKNALDQFELNTFDLIISDLRLPGAPGTDLIKHAGDVPVLIMTSYASLRSAVDSMKNGAIDYIAKPFDHDEMIDAVSTIMANNTKQNTSSQTDTKAKKSSTSHLGEMVGSCPSMTQLYERIKKIAPSEATVLIQGETGTGKELVAKAIHTYSRRKEQPLVCVNCAAIPETLIESELFGYEKGAFTGANTNRMGLIEAADGGTLFLDEIGELPLEAQARLLRFIQEHEIRQIGSVESRKVDVRLVCATHRDLKTLSQEGEFRQDLFYRINVMQLALPPLRERGKDILEIAEVILEQRCKDNQKISMTFSPKAIQAITTYTWPGNIRELENVIERAVILADSNIIDNDLLNIDLELVNISHLRTKKTLQSTQATSQTISEEQESNDNLSLEDYFQRFVLEHQDSMSETELARKLGVSRKCLWERRQRLGIPRKKGAKSAS
jgi:DNA-binding NtrC family response regulator